MENTRQSDSEFRELRGLVDRIKGGDCVLVLGPCVAVRPNDPNRQPLDELLAGEILATIDAPPGEIAHSSTNLRHAADLHERLNQDPEALRDIAKEFYARETASTTAFHRDLAQLPFRLSVSASPDSLMLRAFQQAGKSPQMGHYNFNPSRSVMPSTLSGKSLAAPTPENPLVYHLFGHYDDPASLVLTEGDLIRFLVSVVKGNPPIPDQVRSILADQGASFLFVGFGFQNWYLRVLLHVMDVYGHRTKALAFEDPRFFEHPDKEQTVGFFSGSRRIDFRPLRWEAFAQQLRQTYEAGAPPKSVAVAPPPDAPKAFLSYASEDREAVDRFAEKLQARGIKVWQDTQNLRGGDNWNRVLLDVIERRVDYVIVVQTPVMMTRIDGVYNEEIAAALKHQVRMGEFEGQQLRFIIPTKLGTGASFSSLGQLHHIEVDKPAGFESLVTTIEEDWQRRTALKGLRSAAV